MEKKKLYYKNEKGKYVEYEEPKPPYDNALYRKYRFGKRVEYEPVSMLMTDGLGEGVWVVTKMTYGRSVSSGKYLRDCFMCQKASPIQEVALSKLGGMDKLADYLSHRMEDLPQNVSQYDYCRAIVGILFQYEEEKNK